MQRDRQRTPAGSPGDTGGVTDTPRPPDPSALLLELESRAAEATQAGERIVSALTEGRGTDAVDLERIAAFNHALQSAANQIDGDLGDGDAPTVASLREAVRQAEEAAKRASVAELSGALERLAAMPDAQQGGDLAAACKSEARTLLDSPEWTDQELDLARGFAALVGIAVATDEGVPYDDLVARATELLTPTPTYLPAVGLAVGGTLRLTGDGDQEPPPETPTAAAPEPPAPEQAAEEEVSADPEPASAETPNEAQAGRRPDPADAEVVEAVRTLVAERRIGLAHWIVVAWGGNDGFATALEALAYAEAMRSPVGESAGRLREVVLQIDDRDLQGNPAAKLGLLIAGLRSTLLASHSGGPELLDLVAQSFAEPPALHELIETVMTAGQRGITLAADVTHVRDIATAEDHLKAVQARAADAFALRKIKYQRASAVWREWIQSDGLIGSVLQVVIDDRTERLDEIQRRLPELRNTKALEKQLDDMDRKLRSAGQRKPIVATARQKILERAEESLAIAADWVEISQQLEQLRREKTGGSRDQELHDKLRAVAVKAKDESAPAWDAWSEGDDLNAAFAFASRGLRDEIFALIVDGESPDGSETQVDEILGVDLLRVDRLPVDSKLRPAGALDLRRLLDAVPASDWTAAFERRIADSDFGVAGRILNVVRRSAPDLADKLERTRIDGLRGARLSMKASHDEAERELEAARRLGQISEQDWLSLSNQLSALVLDEQDDLSGAQAEMEAFRDRLGEAKRSGLERARLEYEDRLDRDEQLAPYRDRFKALLEGGEISTLEELVLTVERGKPPPRARGELFKQLTEFFPAVVDDPIASGQTDLDALAEAIADGKQMGSLDFGGVKDEEIEPLQKALKAWRRLSKRDLQTEDVARVLELIGLAVRQQTIVKSPANDVRGRQREIDVTANPLGKALIPAFGSAAGSHYRVVLLWDRLSDDAIVDVVSQQHGDQPLLVLSLGSPLSAATRRGVATQLRRTRLTRAIAVIDQPAFLYLASKGSGKFAATMRIAMPFTAVNPYTPFVAGSVPEEMFFGRRRELDEIRESMGTSFIYGGRRLGKSALLRAAEREVNADGDGSLALYIDLKTQGIGEWRAAIDIVDVLTRALREAKVMTHAASKSASKSPSFEQVHKQVMNWLAQDDGRRMLLLLDECDSFLNADADDKFRSVSQLKALMEDSGRRFKPVFAGLHQVRRFQRIPNQPLAHFGRPISVGPLEPQHAYDLITRPLEALGYKFETPDLPARILTATNYQPSLIQLFCSELIEHMMGRAPEPEAPPFSIATRDVDRVYQTPHVVAEMRTRFELTINLDSRYRVIAYAVAHEASERGLDDGLTPSEIRAICDDFWRAGFQGTTSDEFRALLEEMDSLGILFEQGNRFLMRSPNVLRMLGTSDQIVEQLLASNELELPQRFDAASFRAGRRENPYLRHPLTHQQVADLLEQRAQIRVVVGNTATGIDEVIPSLEEILKDESRLYNFFDATDEGPKRMVGRLRRAGAKKHLVVAYRAGKVPPADTLALIQRVEQQLADNHHPATAVFVLGPDVLETWIGLLAPDDPDAFDQLDFLELKRWDRTGLRAWAQSQDVDLHAFAESQGLNELLKATGGWPLLVDRVVNSYTASEAQRNWREAIEDLEKWLTSAEGAARFCRATGIERDPEVQSAWETILDYGDPMTREDYQLLAQSPTAARSYAVLSSLQVLDPMPEGRFVAEPIAAQAWRTTHPR